MVQFRLMMHAMLGADLYTVLMATCGCTNQEGEVLVECVKLLIEKGADVNAHDRLVIRPSSSFCAHDRK